MVLVCLTLLPPKNRPVRGQRYTDYLVSLTSMDANAYADPASRDITQVNVWAACSQGYSHVGYLCYMLITIPLRQPC